jgi:hypothetical protein
VVTHDEHVEANADDDELTVATWLEDGQLLLSSTSWWDTNVYESRYEYDDSDRLVEIESHRGTPLDLYAWERFTYDDEGRLVDQRHEYEIGRLDFHTWEYDDAGKLSAVEQTSFFGVLRTEFTYDAEGTLISEAPSPGAPPTATYEYPSETESIQRVWVDCDDGSREVGMVTRHVRDPKGRPKRAMNVLTDQAYPDIGLGCGHFDEQFTMEWKFDQQNVTGVITSYVFVDEEYGVVRDTGNLHTTFRYDEAGNYVESTSQQWLGPNVDLDVGHQVWSWFCPGGVGLGAEALTGLREDPICGEPAACP